MLRGRCRKLRLKLPTPFTLSRRAIGESKGAHGIGQPFDSRLTVRLKVKEGGRRSLGRQLRRFLGIALEL